MARDALALPASTVASESVIRYRLSMPTSCRLGFRGK
jgi:hypothetical protein